MRHSRTTWLAAGALAALLAGCTDQDSASRDALRVAGDYRPLSLCLQGELQQQQLGFPVGYAIDEESRRVRIWADQRTGAFGRSNGNGDGGREFFNIFLTQTAPDEVTILVRQTGLEFDRNWLMSRLVPMVLRCQA